MEHSSLGVRVTSLRPMRSSTILATIQTRLHLIHSDLWTYKTNVVILPNTNSLPSATTYSRLVLGNRLGEFIRLSYRHHDMSVTLCLMFPSPGRFWASMMLKTLFAYIVMTYDVKPGEDLPASQYIHGAISTKPSTKLLFRKRVDVDS